MDRRAKFRRGLSSLYIPHYDALCGVLGEEWQPYFGFRTFVEQDQLYAKGRQGNPGEIITNARGGESAHNYGCASDWCLWNPDGTPFWPERNDPQWMPYLHAIEKVRLQDGASFNDFPHNELRIACSWKHVYVAFKQNGMTAAQQKIQESIFE